MNAENKCICSECGNILTGYELADNIYAGLEVGELICYSCQPALRTDLDEDYEDDRE